MFPRKLLTPRFTFAAIAIAAFMPLMAPGLAMRGMHGHVGSYEQTNLVSDIPGNAALTDANLVNAWGISSGPKTPFWISDNGTGVSTLYNVSHPGHPVALSLVVTIPPPGGSPPGTTATPTGNVFNWTTDFTLSPLHPSRFIFATEDGTISGWNPAVDPMNAILKVDNSASAAVYKGLAMGSNKSGNFLFATNFRAGTIDVFDKNFTPATLAGSFQDPSLPACGPLQPPCFAPFGIANIGGQLYVSYAMQDSAKHDDAAGPGSGFVDVFDTNGHFIRRLISNGALNSPWGLVQAPNHFGQFSNDLLVGNFGDGHINAYNPHNGAFRGQLKDDNGNPITIDGLWGLAFGNDGAAGPSSTLFFTAGINKEADGLFGSLVAEK